MATIGALHRRADLSLVGSLSMKSYSGRTLFRPVSDKPTEAAPDYRIFGEADRGGVFEMGAAWIKTRADGNGTFISVKIDFPELSAPVYATLGQMAGQDDPDVLSVIWNRPTEGRATGVDPFAALTPRSAGAASTTLDALIEAPADTPPDTPPATTRRRRNAPADVSVPMPDDDIPA